MGHAPERVPRSVAHEGEVRHVAKGSGRKFEQDPEGGTAALDREGESTNLEYLSLELVGIFTINWKPTGGQSQNTEDTTEASQVQIPVRNPLAHLLHQSQRSLLKS